MKLSQSNTSKISWESSLLELSARKPSQSLLKIHDAGINTIKDLLWIFPLRLIREPEIQNFSALTIDSLFKGEAKLISIKFAPAFGRKGKKNIQLFNASAVVKDLYSNSYLNLKWFNTYPGLKKQLEQTDTFIFLGVVSEYNGVLQITNPKINPKNISDNGIIIEYPTINGVPGNQLRKIFEKIPNSLWQTSIDSPTKSLLKNKVIGPEINESFAILHGKDLTLNEELKNSAKERLIYEEFFEDQLKILARRMTIKLKDSPFIQCKKEILEYFKTLLPYKLTADQDLSIQEILADFQSGSPMMRIVQGDVGCGKTTVALLASLITLKNDFQVALMCPTEQLARQHYQSFLEIFKSLNLNPSLLLGSTKTKEKKEIYQNLENGKIRMIIGTHSLFQDSVKFNNLGLAIIDEQHKFGVEQRLKLVKKGKGTHCLIMTATPIPRTLQLAQFGDLDISSIKTIPSGRKGIKTRIVKDDTYQKYLSFIKTRISLGEQVYVVVPSISESILELKNVEEHEKTYKKYFPNLKIAALHGQLKAEHKQQIMEQFNLGEIDILISTSVIEVGINVINATVMSIYNPDRFGLSSLHQLRGRVGRGSRPGFCFLICDKKVSQEALHRLKIMEKTNDGFEIAEADLKIRGEGDLFGVNQSGSINAKKIASVFDHYSIFQKAIADINEVKELSHEILWPVLKSFAMDEKISTTI